MQLFRLYQNWSLPALLTSNHWKRRYQSYAYQSSNLGDCGKRNMIPVLSYENRIISYQLSLVGCPRTIPRSITRNVLIRILMPRMQVGVITLTVRRTYQFRIQFLLSSLLRNELQMIQMLLLNASLFCISCCIGYGSYYAMNMWIHSLVNYNGALYK